MKLFYFYLPILLFTQCKEKSDVHNQNYEHRDSLIKKRQDSLLKIQKQYEEDVINMDTDFKASQKIFEDDLKKLK